jgi:MoaA/NifB/PqqE/SkfB family radical SAM enzyme
VVGGSACNAKCPYCVSKLTGCTNGIEVGQKAMDINKRNFNIGCNFAKMSGVSTVLLTGKGEPTLYPDHITRYLEQLEKWQFPFIELQTNGILLHELQDELKEWYDAGLTTVSLSVADYLSNQNMQIFGDNIQLEANIERLHRIGFSVRISCVGVAGMIDTVEKVFAFTKWCKEHEVEQLTWRPATNVLPHEVGDDPVQRDVYEWIEANGVKNSNLIKIQDYFTYTDGTVSKLLELAHGASVFDVDGQNISINSCLTSSTDPDDIRQLIFSSDGHLRYSWTKEGAIIL